MAYNPEVHHRHSLRLQGYDYSAPGAYFITICSEGRECLFGSVVGHEMELNAAGHMVRLVWEALPDRFPEVRLDQSVIMPNHVHGIVLLEGASRRGTEIGATTWAGAKPGHAAHIVGAPLVGALSAHQRAAAPKRVAPTIGSIVGAFKSTATHEYTLGVKNQGWPPFPGRLWQRNYYEHIIRNEAALKRIREYIATNAARWETDRENPQRKDEDEFDRWLDTFKKGKSSGDPS